MNFGTIHLQILGTNTGDSNPSIFLFSDHHRYIFNVGEGCQRFCMEHKIKIAKIHNIFLTKLSNQCINGLPGMLLTIADMGVKDICIHGPPNTKQYIDACAYYLRRRENNRLFSHEYGNKYIQDYSNPQITSLMDQNRQGNAFYSDDLLDIHVALLSSTSNIISNIEYSNTIIQRLQQRYIVGDQPNGFRFSDELLKYNENGELCISNKINKQQWIMCYRGKLHDTPGKFKPIIAQQLGLKPGPLYGKLKNGHSVTFEKDGKNITIEPHQVLGTKQIGASFAIIDCPYDIYITSLINHTLFNHDKNTLRWMIHITPMNIINNTKYMKWMKSFNDYTQHIFINAEICIQRPVFVAQWNNHLKLNNLCSNVFPQLMNGEDEVKKEYKKQRLNYKQNININGIAGANLMKLQLHPNQGKILSNGDFEILTTTNENYDNLIHEHKLDEYCKKTNNESINYPEIIFLGTGSAIPSKYRNVSGILYRINEKLSILFDAGEGSFGQLVRLYGFQGAEYIVSTLQCIWISHMHADHHLGLMTILHNWYKYHQNTDRILTLIGPKMLWKWLCNIESCTIDSFKFKFWWCGDINDRNKLNNVWINDQMNILNIQSIPVIHCRDAYAVLITDMNNIKIVYSGDTRPCDNLIEFGKNCDILIHEASLDDELVQLAIEKKHCTTSEAINIAQRMQAKFTILTHFSQRYPKLPTFNGADNICVAFDFMKLDMKSIKWVSKLTPLLTAIFNTNDDDDEDEEINLKRL